MSTPTQSHCNRPQKPSILFNSVNDETGEKYHCSREDYYKQIRAVSDRICREHGMSVIMEGEGTKSMSYIEWLRQSKGQPTFRSMLEADSKVSMEDANDLGHFFMLMEDKGYEIKHGNRLGFKLRGQEHFMYPERKNPQYSEEGIRNFIDGNLWEIEMGRKPVVTYGQKDMSEWSAFVDTLYDMGIETAIEARQAAYDDYLNS